MDLATFIDKRRPAWRRLEEVLDRVEGSGLAGLDDDQAVEFGRLYRGAASDLNQAQTFVRGDAVVEYLNGLVARSYAVIYARERPDVGKLVRHYLWGYPAVFRRYFGHFLLATAFFTAGAAFGFVAYWFDQQATESFLLPDLSHSIRPHAEGPAHDTGGLVAGSMWYFTHNTWVTLVAFALGVTYGVGTAWFMFYNGILVGALAGVFARAGALLQFCTDVLPHGVVEIPAMLIGGAAGFVLAEGMIRARPWSRRDELARCGKEAILLVSGIVPLLAAAGVLEQCVARAPSALLDTGFKLFVASAVGLLFASYIFALGWSPEDVRSSVLGRLLNRGPRPLRAGA